LNVHDKHLLNNRVELRRTDFCIVATMLGKLVGIEQKAPIMIGTVLDEVCHILSLQFGDHGT